MTTQSEFNLAMKATVETLSDSIKAFAKQHATVRVKAAESEKPYREWFTANVVPYLPTVSETTDKGITYVAGFDKKDPRFKASRDTYKDSILPYWIAHSESVWVTVGTEDEEITPAMAMTDDTRAIPKGPYKEALMELRNAIKNNVDQEWCRLLPEFDKPESDAKTDAEIVAEFITMYTKRQKKNADAGRKYVHVADIKSAEDLLLAFLSAEEHGVQDAQGAAILNTAGVSVAA
jgi:hypothetical protein